MKKICFFSLIISQFIWSQEQVKPQQLEFEPSFRINIAQNINYGTNFLADANKPALGYGFDFGFMSYSKFNAYFGYEHSYYRTTNIEKAGNINSTRLNTLSFKVLYETPIYKDFSVQPFIGVGAPTLHFKSGDQSFGKQNGTDFTIGSYVYYKIAKSFAIYLGAEMNYSKYKIETVPEYEAYYKNANAVKISCGIRLK
jgi:hypothetical protein